MQEVGIVGELDDFSNAVNRAERFDFPGFPLLFSHSFLNSINLVVSCGEICWYARSSCGKGFVVLHSEVLRCVAHFDIHVIGSLLINAKSYRERSLLSCA